MFISSEIGQSNLYILNLLNILFFYNDMHQVLKVLFLFFIMLLKCISKCFIMALPRTLYICSALKYNYSNTLILLILMGFLKSDFCLCENR